MSSKIILSNVPEKYPKLASAYEKETGAKTVLLSGNISKGFTRWIQKKIEYKSLTCKNPNCSNFGQRFDSIKSLNRHNGWHNKKTESLNMDDHTSESLNMDDHTSEFFLKFLFEHSYFSNSLLAGIYHDTFHPEVDKYKIIRTRLLALVRYHVNLGALEKFNTRTYKINKEVLKEHYGNGEVIGKS